jgi:outer membrane scaffolding protein for murein synthesis (MipA/OmpV family)
VPTRKGSLAVLAAALSVFAAAAAAQDHGPSDGGFLWGDWSFVVGAGAEYRPDYEGSDDYEWNFLPHATATWRDLATFGRVRGGWGAEVTPLRYDGFSLALGLAWQEGRDSGDNSALVGLGDVDDSLVGTVTAANSFDWAEIYASLQQDFTGNRDGTAVEAGVHVPLPVAETGVRLNAGASVTWVDEDYMQKTFGVNAAQAARTGYGVHDADAGLKDIGASLIADYDVTDTIGVTVGGEVRQLLGDAASSPIVDGRGSATQARVFGGVTYRF